jgi:hypothetical protein
VVEDSGAVALPYLPRRIVLEAGSRVPERDEVEEIMEVRRGIDGWRLEKGGTIQMRVYL